MSTLEIFAGVNDRMAGLFGMFGSGSNVVDHSTRLREQMSALGIPLSCMVSHNLSYLINGYLHLFLVFPSL